MGRVERQNTVSERKQSDEQGQAGGGEGDELEVAEGDGGRARVTMEDWRCQWLPSREVGRRQWAVGCCAAD